MEQRSSLSEAELLALRPGLPDADFHMHLGVRRGSTKEFFAATAENEALLRERRALLMQFPERHSALLPEGEEVLQEMLDVLDLPVHSADPMERLREAGTALEPDMLLLRRDNAHTLRLVGGCLCFPSSWSLKEKMGKTLEEIHEPVPGVNATIGTQIDTFLSHMKPGHAWLRSNWGLSRFPDRNQHTELHLPKLEVHSIPEHAYLRMEHQALVALPHTNGILFGIRIAVHPLPDIAHTPEAAAALARQLSTMQDEMMQYKNITQVRGELLQTLKPLQ